jgi:iron complex transport system substrate-binding protein
MPSSQKLTRLTVLITSIFIQAFTGQLPVHAEPLRVISLAPAATEILFALGLDEEIVGVSSFCDYPEKARSKEKAGSFSQPNMEKIIFLKPDIIFCTGLEQDSTVVALRRLGLNVFVSDPASMEELYVSIRDIAGRIGRVPEAERLIKAISEDLAHMEVLHKRVPAEKKMKVFVEIWHSPLMTAGKGSYLDELVRLAGGENIAYDTPRPYCIFSAEQVIQRDPDCIFLTYMDSADPLQKVGHRFGWEGVSAVRNKRVYNDIDANLILRPGPRAAQGVRELYKRLYP